MATSSRVRTHTRRTATGKTTTVRQHSRSRRGRRRAKRPGLFSLRHAWQLAGKAIRAGRRHKKGTAVLLGGLAFGELAAWLMLRGVGFMLVTFGMLAIAVASVAIAAAGGELK